MAYKALYRTYRPQRFEDVIGQDVIVKTLQNAIANGKITHAYLFSGPRGTGKTTVARILAKALNCSYGTDNEPCNECTSCKEIMEGNNPDVIEIDAASNNGVDEIREIREKVKFLPGESKYKVYIIDEVHMLTTSAFNALLKTLEEPPKHVIFILATTEPQKVLPTILSRCQRYDFKSLTVNEIEESILKVAKEENVNISKEAVVAIAESAEGGMRDALSYLDQAISLSEDEVTIEDVNSVTGNLSYDKIIELAKCFEDKRISEALKIVNELLNLGKEVNKIIVSMLQFYRDILLYKTVDTSDYSKYIFEKDSFKELASRIDEKRIFYYVEVLSETQNKLRLSTTPHIFLEVALIKMINVSESDLNLIDRVKSLQEKIDSLEKQEISYTPGYSNENVNSEKVSIIEEKINRVVSELGKLELPKLIQRVGALEAKAVNVVQESNNKDYEKEIDKIKEDLYLVQANYNALQNIKDNGNAKEIDLSNYDEKIDKLEKMISEVLANKEINYDEINDLISDRLRDARREVSIDYNQVVALVDEKVSKINLSEAPKNNISIKYQNEDEIKIRIENLEEKIYKIMSGALASQPTPTRKSRNTVNENQIVLFGDDLVAVDNIEKRSVKERFNFNGFEKEDAKKTNKEENLFTVMKEEYVEDPEKIVFEKTVIPQKEEIVEEKKEVSVFGESRFENNTPAEAILNRSVEVLSNYGEKEESKVDLFGKNKYEQDTPAEKILNRSVEKLAEEDKKPKSQLVIRQNGEDKIVKSKSDLFSGEKEELKKELASYKTDEGIIARNVPAINESEELDEFEMYSINVIERILNESREEENKNDKIRIVNMWNNLVDLAPVDKKAVAEVMQEGVVVAVGTREFIIVYSSASICNQVMKRKFKRESLKLLFDLLGSTYNYMALPESVWRVKRAEYASQYNIGVKNIRLQPINEPILNALMSDDDVSPEERMIENAEKLFGSDIIEYKE